MTFHAELPRITARSVHILLGVTLLAVVLARMVWRLRWGQRLPLASPGPAGYLAKTIHYALYGLLLAVLLLRICQRVDARRQHLRPV